MAFHVTSVDDFDSFMLVIVIKAGYSQTYVLTFAVVSTGRELECVAEDCLMVALSDDFRVKKV